MIFSFILFIPFTSRYLYSHLVRTTGREGNERALDYRGDFAKFPKTDEEHGGISSPGKIGIAKEDNGSIPIQVEPDPTPVESLDWDLNVASRRIPAFLSKELKFKRKLFVGIIAPSPHTEILAKRIPTTWGESWVTEGNGDMTFYSTMGVDVTKYNGFNYVSLAGSSTLPNVPTPQMMYQVLKDICSQHIDTHHFYFVANADTYVSLPDLFNFTMHLNESESLWIGHGTSSSGRKRLYRNDPETFCHSGPGFILSRRSMQGVCPHLTTCEQFYGHSDEMPGYELARCFRRFLNINCTISKEAHSLFYMSDTVLDPYMPSRPYESSLVVHPVKDEASLYVLHQYFIERQLNYSVGVNQYFYSIIQKMDKVLVKEGGMPDDRLVLGRDGNANKYHHPEIIAWDRIDEVSPVLAGRSSNRVISVDEQDPEREATGHENVVLSDIRDITLQHILEKYLSEDDRDGDIDTGTIFRRVVPGVGLQYMVDVTEGNMQFATVCIDQPYERVMTYTSHTSQTVKINFILPLRDGSKEFQGFMQMFEQACMSADQPQSVGLLVVLYRSEKSNMSDGEVPDEKSSETLSLLNLYKQKYPKLSLRWINAGTSVFSYIKAIEMAVLALPTDTLVCSIKLNNQMSPEFLHHIRLNTVQHERLFFPSSFQFFKDIFPETSRISHGSGFWRSFDYSTFCGYKQDIMQACGGDKFVSGQDLFEKSIQSGLDVFRAPEYALLSKWHESDCDNKWLDEEERTGCLEERKFTNLALSAATVR